MPLEIIRSRHVKNVLPGVLLLERAVKTERVKWSVIRIMLLALCAVVFGMGVFAVTHRQSAFMAMGVSAVCAALTVLWTRLKVLFAKIRSRRSGRIVINSIAAFAFAAVLYAAVISGIMLVAANRAPSDGATLIVLGCRVYGEDPSLMLYRRMDAALEILSNNPEAVAILSGGQGPGEWITEAEAMRRYFTENGISEDRLFIENLSTSTYENIAFSTAIIEDCGLSRNVAIVTNGFHQFRAQSYAKNAGLTPGAVSAGTPVFTLPYYWVREIAAISVQVIFGVNP